MSQSYSVGGSSDAAFRCRYCGNLFIQADKDERLLKETESTALNVCITGATSPICYSMLAYLADGDIFGPDTTINVHLYDR